MALLKAVGLQDKTFLQSVALVLAKAVMKKHCLLYNQYARYDREESIFVQIRKFILVSQVLAKMTLSYDSVVVMGRVQL